MTGRTRRVVRKNGRFIVENRHNDSKLDNLNVTECKRFQSGEKCVAIISDAASTGISLHADRRANNTRRRVHFTIELPWSADRAVQQLGRSHRSNADSSSVGGIPCSPEHSPYTPKVQTSTPVVQTPVSVPHAREMASSTSPSQSLSRASQETSSTS